MDEEKFDLELEDKFNSLNHIKSLDTLEFELVTAEEIIENIKEDPELIEEIEYFETKVEEIKIMLSDTKENLQKGDLSKEDYKLELEEQLKFENSLLKEVKNIKNKGRQAEFKERVEKRIRLVTEEISSMAEKAEKEEEKEDNEQIGDNLGEEPEMAGIADKMLEAFDDMIEDEFHSAKTMKSMMVLQKEKELVEKMNEIAEDKENDEAIDCFEMKITVIDKNITQLENLHMSGQLTPEGYKKLILQSKEQEEKMLAKLKAEEENTKHHETRIKHRMYLIDKEIADMEGQQAEEAKQQKVEEKVEEPEEEQISQGSEENKSEAKESPKETKIKSDIFKTEKKSKMDSRSKAIYNSISKILEGWKDAYYYCEYIGDEAKTKEAQQKCVECKTLMSEAEKNKLIDNKKTPNRVTADFICGMTQEERKQHYKEAIQFLLPTYREAKEAYETRIEQVKRMKPSEFRKIKQQITEDVNAKQKRKNGFETLLKKIKADLENEWIPPPSVTQAEEQFEVEVCDEDIESDQVKVELKEVSFKEPEMFAKIVLGPVLSRNGG